MDYEVKDIKKDIIDPSNTMPVVIDFWAEWCGPCRTLGPVIERLAESAGGRWKLVKVDVDNPNNQALAAQFQIRSIPAVRMIFQGKLLAEFNGALPEPEIRKWLDQHLPGKENGPDEEIDEMEAAIKAGDRSRALEYTRKLAEKDPQNDDLKIKLALLMLPAAYQEAAALVEYLSEKEVYELEISAVRNTARIAVIAEGKAEPDPPGAAMAGVYREACQDLMAERFEEAAEKFIKVLMSDRNLEEDGARRSCLALFKMLGEQHPVTLAYRRRFSMALY